MKKTSLTHDLKGLIYLDILNLEEKISTSSSNQFFNTLHFLDLSQVRFAELSAIVKLTLYIEVLLKSESEIFIALPTTKLTPKEAASKDFAEELKANILKARIKANNFIKTVGFIKAIREISSIYGKDIFISEEFDFETNFQIEAFNNAFHIVFETKSIEYNDYKYVFPIEWIDVKKGLEDFSVIEDRIDKILENPERGLESIDVQGIKNVIVSELIKNVLEHAETKYGLFSIGLIDSFSLLRDQANKKVNPIEKDYLDWLKTDGVKSQVEIYFGDTGKGLLSKDFEKKYIQENNTSKNKQIQLKWAFEKWSTIKNNELRRGTKGLYRIQRIVNKYNGIFHITTLNQNGGFQKGGYIEEEWVWRESKTDNQGTFIQIKLCPFSEAKSFRFILKDNPNKKKWKTVQYNPKVETDFLTLFKRDIKQNDNLLVILNLKEVEDEEAKSILENCLPEFSYDSHPSAVIVYPLTKLKNDPLRIIADSANEFILKKAGTDVFQEFSHKDAEEVYDPVLIIGHENQAFWYGGNQELIELLNASYNSKNDNLKISQFKEYIKLNDEIKTRIRLHLENDNKLVNVNRDGKIVFNFINIEIFFENEIVKKIETSSKNEEVKYCSPKLEVVESWLNIRELLQYNNYGYALALYLKFKKHQNSQRQLENDSLSNYFILIDHKQQKELAKAFASLYGINHKNIKVVTEDINPNIPRRTKLFPEKSHVIILTTIISSSETVRRLVKYIKRDSATPLIILSLCNYRKYNIGKLETWDELTDIISIFQKNKIEQPKPDRDEKYFIDKALELNKDLIYMNPSFKLAEVIVPADLNLSLPTELRHEIITQKSLHYNHIGIFRDRHFTFYLDKEKLLKEKSIIWELLSNSISNWQIEHNINKFSIYLPASLFPGGFHKNNFYTFLNTLSKNIKIVDQEVEFHIDQNIVFLDFGIISGKSINSVITKCKQVEHLLVCILFDQSKSNELEFYQKINNLSNSNLLNTSPTSFRIEYLYKLPLGYYTSENCPICEHSRALDYYKIKLNYMFDFSEDRQRRLKLIESEELKNTEYPYDFYYSTEHTDHELSSVLIMKMFELKILLEKAETNTQWRVETFKYLFKIYKETDKYLLNCDSEIYALIYFLSNEINWLQKEPFVFRDFRDMLASISHEVSTLNLLDLAKRIQASNTSATTPIKLAVRYKYSAISLLRSTNKFLFCKSLSEIINSSVKHDGEFSNNLLQNTFYHILSLYKNKYNKSNSYYNGISEQLNLLLNKKNAFTPEQKAILFFLDTYNNVFYIASDLKVIKSLKKYHSEHYTTNHPFPDNCMNNINLSEFAGEGLVDLAVNGEKSIYYNDLFLLSEDLIENWMRVSNYIYSMIQVHTEKLSDSFKNSAFFQTIFFDEIIKNIFDGNYLLGVTDDFSVLVNKIHDNPLLYLVFKDQYDSLHNRIYLNIISRESKFSTLISQFPTDVKNIAVKKFKKIIKVPITGLTDSYEIFYPKYKLKEAFDLILNNIEKRLNKGLLLADVNMSIEIKETRVDEIKYISLLISYDSTDKTNMASRSGGLSDIKKEIEYFGGSLEYDASTDQKGNFNLMFKFLKYE